MKSQVLDKASKIKKDVLYVISFPCLFDEHKGY